MADLGEGRLEGIIVECPRHGARFELTTGRPLCMPATEPVQTFGVEIRDDGIYVEVPE